MKVISGGSVETSKTGPESLTCWALRGAVFIMVFAASTAMGAARSTHVVIKNNTDHVMSFISGRAQHGIVTRNPPTTIPPGGIGELFAESKGFATGTEGTVVYGLAGVNGSASFHWDNPFVGTNSASGSGPPGFGVGIIGDAGNRTLVFFSVHDAAHPAAVCNARWVLDHLGTQAEGRLDDFSRGIGFLSTPFKRLGFGGWVDTGCEASAQGTPVRDAQHSTDGFWTIDVQLQTMTIEGLSISVNPTRFVRIEVEPNTPANSHGAAKAGQPIQFSGRVLIDTHHGDELIEVHPFNPITLASVPLPFGPDTCKQGFVWRETTPSDHVCVAPAVREQARADNAQADTRREPNGGAYGPDTCTLGFVWREATPADHVCVTPQIRAATADDNQHAVERRMQP